MDFLHRINRLFLDAEQDRYLLERSLTISSKEMRDLYEELRQKSESALARERDKLREAKELAEEADRAKGTFVASVSHEMRTPLNAIIGLTGLLLDIEREAEDREMVEMIRASSKSLLALINDVLDFSKIESDKLELDEETFSLEACVEDSLGLVASDAAAKGLKVKTEIEAGATGWFRGDASRVRQVLVNLLSNAVKFTDAGSVSVRVSSIGSRESDRLVCFAVRDTGVGIAPEHLNHLFDPFTQGDGRTSRRHGGTGLGLAISRRLVHLMGGHLEVTSVERRGSVFHFTVPLRAVDSASVGERALEGRGGEEIRIDRDLARRVPLRILLVEDNLVNQKVLALVLERMGYRSDVAANGLEAVDAVRQREYDLIFMDVRMPEMDGIEATHRIRTLDGAVRQPRIVALSAGASDLEMQKCLAAGMDGYLSKPVQALEIQAVVENMDSSVPLADESPEEVQTPSRDAILEVLGELEAISDESTVTEVIDTFLETVPTQMEAIRQAVATGDVAELGAHCHTLRGGSGALGAKRLAALSFSLEEVCREGSLEGAGTLVEAMDRELDRVQGLLLEARPA